MSRSVTDRQTDILTLSFLKTFSTQLENFATSVYPYTFFDLFVQPRQPDTQQDFLKVQETVGETIRENVLETGGDTV